MTSRNDGKRLETLVELIEGLYLAPGFNVIRNQPVYSEAGVQTAELDVLIVGKVGTVETRILFECRDRPSEGAQGVGWIEQLVGRRSRLGLNTIIAVSTTGFSPAAIEEAKRSNIPLRTVEQLTEEDISGWLPVTAPVWYRRGKIVEIKKLICIPEGKTREWLNEHGEGKRTEWTLDPKRKMILNRESNQCECFDEVWNRLLIEKADAYFVGIPPDAQPVIREIVVDDQFKSRYLFLLDDRIFQIETLVIIAELRLCPSQAPLQFAVNYGVDGNPTETIAQWRPEGESPFSLFTVKLIRLPDDDGAESNN